MLHVPNAAGILENPIVQLLKTV